MTSKNQTEQLQIEKEKFNKMALQQTTDQEYEQNIIQITQQEFKKYTISQRFQKFCNQLPKIKSNLTNLFSESDPFYLNYHRKYVFHGQISQMSFGKIYNYEESQDQGVYIVIKYYEGEVSNMRPNGKGRYISNDFRYEEGTYQNGLLTGLGFLKTQNGYIYKGQYLQGLPHGYGEEYYPNKVKYCGYYVNGQKTGPGQLIYSPKEYYIGQFRENQFYGQGEYYWSDGRSYKGTWLNNKMHGKGVFKWQDGSNFIGSYIQDQKEGPGVLNFPNGASLNAVWANGYLEGEGTIKIGGLTYIGEWKQGKRIQWISDPLRLKKNINKIIKYLDSKINQIKRKRVLHLQTKDGEQGNFLEANININNQGSYTSLPLNFLTQSDIQSQYSSIQRSYNQVHTQDINKMEQLIARNEHSKDSIEIIAIGQQLKQMQFADINQVPQYIEKQKQPSVIFIINYNIDATIMSQLSTSIFSEQKLNNQLNLYQTIQNNFGNNMLQYSEDMLHCTINTISSNQQSGKKQFLKSNEINEIDECKYNINQVKKQMELPQDQFLNVVQNSGLNQNKFSDNIINSNGLVQPFLIDKFDSSPNVLSKQANLDTNSINRKPKFIQMINLPSQSKYCIKDLQNTSLYERKRSSCSIDSKFKDKSNQDIETIEAINDDAKIDQLRANSCTLMNEIDLAKLIDDFWNKNIQKK